MPQLDQIWSYPSQVFWLVVSFAVLYYVLSRIALPKVSDLLQERQERIDADLEKAENLKKEAETVLAAYEAAMADARGKAQAQRQPIEQLLDHVLFHRHKIGESTLTMGGGQNRAGSHCHHAGVHQEGLTDDAVATGDDQLRAEPTPELLR